MTRILRFAHRGIRAAIPAQQADGISRGSDGVERVWLWTGRSDTDDRWLRLRAASGTCCVSCQQIELLDVHSEALIPISKVVSGALQLPHVVGFATLENLPMWLVDASRLTLRTDRQNR